MRSTIAHNGPVRSFSLASMRATHPWRSTYRRSPIRVSDRPLGQLHSKGSFKAGPSILTFFAHEPQSRVLCYGNANLTRDETPVLAKSFPSGTHRFKFVNPALKLSVERAFEIQPGKTTTIVVDLNKGSAELQSDG